MTDCVNLDDMTTEDLQAFYDSKLALFGSPRATGNDSKLRNYAMLALKARRARLGGAINDALNYESRMQNVYDTLPKGLKW